jgi:phage terminase large subunit
MAADVNAQFPEAASVLFDDAHRFIALHGGRGSGKSWSVARALLIRASQKKLRILCCRELQNSIAESVHKLLSTQIDELGLSGFYTVQNTSITGINGSEFIFAGLKNNATKIKSYEGVDIAYCEEAQAITKASWQILTPTIRKPGSQIIAAFNPVLETDFIYQFFVVDPPKNAVVVRMNYTENPWFCDPLLTEMRTMEAADPDGYANVWLGYPRQTLDGAIYAKEMRQAQQEGRITKVPYDRSKPVHCFFDLGRRDHTGIWFAQVVGFEFRVLRYYQNRGFALDHYLRVLQEQGYVFGDMWLPHDAENELLASKRTIAQQMREAGYTVRITPKIGMTDGINAARTIFPNVWFDEVECSDGLNCLRRYRYDVDPDTGQFSLKPLHDEASDGADAFRYLAVALREKGKTKVKEYKPFRPVSGAGAWMS